MLGMRQVSPTAKGRRRQDSKSLKECEKETFPGQKILQEEKKKERRVRGISNHLIFSRFIYG